MTDEADNCESGPSLDPDDWSDFRLIGHRMLDDMINYLQSVRDRPVWRPIPQAVRDRFQSPMPATPQPLAQTYEEFSEFVLPYTVGNVHPGFMGWVHGGGTPVGMLAEMLAAGLNANLGGRDHIPVDVERQIVRWMSGLLGFPAGASGLFVTGTSMANFIALLVAKTKCLGAATRRDGLRDDGRSLRVYASTAAHNCIVKATEMTGLGRDALRLIPVDARHRLDTGALRQAVADDIAAGKKPCMVVATAGTVDVGAIDDLRAIGDVCRELGVWFHIDGAYGAMGMMSPDIAPRLSGIDLADSIALDFHKWLQVPYDAGFILVKDAAAHRAAFSSPASYLHRYGRGLAAGNDWPCDFGPDLSRGFRALKTWFTIKTFGADRLGAMMARTCELARYLERRILAEAGLELLMPVQLNIVCFRALGGDIDALNGEIVMRLHESGIAAPSTTTLDGKLAIRAAIFNHRTDERDLDRMLDAVLSFQRDLSRQPGADG